MLARSPPSPPIADTGPIFSRHHGRVLCIYDRNFLTTTCRFPQIPPLTSLQVEALDLLEALAESREYRLDMELAPGDMQFLHNHQVRSFS